MQDCGGVESVPVAANRRRHTATFRIGQMPHGFQEKKPFELDAASGNREVVTSRRKTAGARLGF